MFSRSSGLRRSYVGIGPDFVGTGVLDAALNFIVAKEAEMTVKQGDAWRHEGIGNFVAGEYKPGLGGHEKSPVSLGSWDMGMRRRTGKLSARPDHEVLLALLANVGDPANGATHC
jgi:hypothetical protein